VDATPPGFLSNSGLPTPMNPPKVVIYQLGLSATFGNQKPGQSLCGHAGGKWEAASSPISNEQAISGAEAARASRTSWLTGLPPPGDP